MEKKQKRKVQKGIRKSLCQMMAAAFAGIIVIFAVISALVPDKKFSDEENRVLESFPRLTGESVKNKEYMTSLESYTSDQFLLRDLWIRLKVKCDLLVGKREFNGVYLGKDKYLMQIPEAPDQENVQENLDAINEFADRNVSLRTNVMIVPNAVSVIDDYLPKGAPVRDQKKDMSDIKKQLSDNIQFIDVTSVLEKHVDEQIYYKTDHHWTSRGARYGFEAAVEQLGISEPVSDYEVYTVAVDFSGTLASTSGYHKTKDSVEVYAPKDVEVEYLVSDSDDPEKRPTMYDKDALKKKDKYQVFFGGNHSMVDVTTANETDKRLIIFKDSYANCFVQFLFPYYNEIVMIDPRYYYDNIQRVIENEEITDVLFLYNIDTFLNDNSIADVLVEG